MSLSPSMLLENRCPLPTIMTTDEAAAATAVRMKMMQIPMLYLVWWWWWWLGSILERLGAHFSREWPASAFAHRSCWTRHRAARLCVWSFRRQPRIPACYAGTTSRFRIESCFEARPPPPARHPCTIDGLALLSGSVRSLLHMPHVLLAPRSVVPIMIITININNNSIM